MEELFPEGAGAAGSRARRKSVGLVPASSRRVMGLLSLETYRDPVRTPAYLVFRYLESHHDASYDTFVACKVESIQYANRLLAVYQNSVPESVWRVVLEVAHDLPAAPPGTSGTPGTPGTADAERPEVFLRRCVAVANMRSVRHSTFVETFVSVDPDAVRLNGMTRHFDSI